MNRNEREHRIGGMNHMNRHVTWMLSESYVVRAPRRANESNQRRVPIDMNGGWGITCRGRSRGVPPQFNHKQENQNDRITYCDVYEYAGSEGFD